MHDQESNLTVWGLGPRCTSKDDRHPMLRGIGHHHAISLCRYRSLGGTMPHLCNLDLTSIAKDFDNCAELVSSPHYEPLTKPALCLFPELLNSSQRCVLRAIFTNDFCPRCCVWRTSATRTFMDSDFLHSGTLVRTSQTRMVSQHLSAMKSFNTFSANSSCDRMCS